MDQRNEVAFPTSVALQLDQVRTTNCNTSIIVHTDSVPVIGSAAGDNDAFDAVQAVIREAGQQHLVTNANAFI